MTSKILAAIEATLLGFGYQVKKTIGNDEILEVIKLLRPISTEIELIRIGGEGDGGYLVPNDIDGIKYCFSPGVGLTSSFEEDITKRGVKSLAGTSVFLVDTIILS